MKNLKNNISAIKKAIYFAFAALCLSFVFSNDSFANNINSDNKFQIVYSTKTIKESSTLAFAAKKNDVCNVDKMRERYQTSCYSCIVVRTLTETFMNACSKVYPVSRDAGSKIAIIGAMIWLVLFAMKNVSSFTSLEPSNNIHDFFVFIFKVFVALVFINAGIGILIEYIIEPILIAGADYGMGILQATTHNTFSPPDPDFAYKGVELVSSESMNKLLGVNQAIDKKVSENLVIGNALVCHSMNAGAWVDESFLGFFTIKIPNLWILICGAAIWFIGFMLTLAISFYVLDVSFKLGFSIILLPIAIGLWPFAATSDKLPKILSIILKSAAIFAFLAITTSYALELIGAAMRDLGEFYDRIKNDDATWVSKTFEITGPYFLIIIFAYLYSIKMIGGTIGNYVDKFFSDAAFGSASPIHHKATQAVDIAKQKSMGIAKGAAKLGGRAAKGIGKGAWKGAKGAVSFAKGGETGGTTVIGNALKMPGKFVQLGGKATAALGRANQNVKQKLQNFGDKQVDKGLQNKSLFRLATGDLAKRLAHAAPSGNTLAKMSNAMESRGQKMEKAGLYVNQKYRDGKGVVKTESKKVAKWTGNKAKQTRDAAKGVVRTASHSIQSGAAHVYNKTSDYVQSTKAYQVSAKAANKIANVAVKGATKLENGYIAASTGAKGVYRSAAITAALTADRVEQAAIRTAEKAGELAQRTWAYKGGEYVVNKTVQAGKFVGKKSTQAYNATEQGARTIRNVTKGAYRETKEAIREGIVESGIYKSGQAFVQNTVQLSKDVRQGIQDTYEDTRGGVGNTVNITKQGVKDLGNEVGSAVKGVATTAGEFTTRPVRKVAKMTKEGMSKLNNKMFDKFGANLIDKHTERNESVAAPTVTRASPVAEQQRTVENVNPVPQTTIEQARPVTEQPKTFEPSSSVREETKRKQELEQERKRILEENLNRLSSLTKEERDDLTNERRKLQNYSLAFLNKSMELDTLAKNAQTEEERKNYMHEAAIMKETAKEAQRRSEKISAAFEKERLTIQKPTSAVMTHELREKMNEEDKKLYDEFDIKNGQHMKEYSEKEKDQFISNWVRNQREAEDVGLSLRTVEGNGYCFKTNRDGDPRGITVTQVDNYVSVDALSDEDRKRYDDLLEKNKKENSDISEDRIAMLAKRDFLEEKYTEFFIQQKKEYEAKHPEGHSFFKNRERSSIHKPRTE